MNAPVIVPPVAALAAEINAEHKLAQQAAETAIQHAIRCGELLLSVKAGLKHGKFMPWIEQNCSIPQGTASRYMKAAVQIRNGLQISSIRGIFPSGKIKKIETPVRQIEDQDHAGGVDHRGDEQVVQHRSYLKREGHRAVSIDFNHVIRIAVNTIVTLSSESLLIQKERVTIPKTEARMLLNDLMEGAKAVRALAKLLRGICDDLPERVGKHHPAPDHARAGR